jgi:hypothetical protein
VRFCGRDGGIFRVAGCTEPDYAVASFEVVEIAAAGGDYGSFCFAAENFGLGGGVEP